MVAAMAVELFIYMYAFAFAISAVIAIVLLVRAARRLAQLEQEQLKSREPKEG